MRRISILGLVAACAMAFSAVLASGAMGAVETSNTAFTCVPGAGGLNAHCDPGSSGTSGHVAIGEGVETGLELSALTEPELSTKIGLVKVTLKGTKGVECVNCMAHNQNVGGTMDVTGSGGQIRFTGVEISTNGCVVVNEEVLTEKLKLTTLSPTKAELSPETGEVMAVVQTTNAAEKTCPLPKEIKVTGHANGTLKGATVNFNTGAGELKVGTQEANLKGEATVTAGVTGASYNPVALTAS